MKHLLFFLLIITSTATFGQRLKRADKAIINDLKTTVTFLASDEMEGRRTGTPGEKLAYEYLSGQLEQIGLQPKGTNGSYLQPFDVNEGKQIMPETHFSIDGNKLEVEKDFFPFIYSPNGKISSYASPAIKESDAPWFLDLKEILENNENNPHFDLTDAIKTKAAECKSKGATALIVHNSGSKETDLKFEGKSKMEAVGIPIVFITKDAAKKYLSESTMDHKIDLQVAIGEKKRSEVGS